MYHSATPVVGADYERKVMAAWPEETRVAAAPGTSPLARAWAASLGGSSPATGLGGSRSGTMASFGSPFAASHGLVSFAVRRPSVLPIMASAAPGMATPPGRSLAAYRAMPIMLAARIPLARMR